MPWHHFSGGSYLIQHIYPKHLKHEAGTSPIPKERDNKHGGRLSPAVCCCATLKPYFSRWTWEVLISFCSALNIVFPQQVVFLFCFFVTSEAEERSPGGDQEGAQGEGFGKLYPSARPGEEQDERSGDERDVTSGVISRKELEKGRLSREGKPKF